MIPSKGKRGEKYVALRLKKLPKEEYRVINDLLFSCQAHSTQIDHVVVSSYGIFVIETKYNKGWIYGMENSEYWTQNIYGKKYQLYNPINQNFGHIKRLKILLKDFGELPFISIVAFSSIASLKISTSHHVVYWNQINSVIRKYNKKVLDDRVVEQIYRRLLISDNDSKRAEKTHIASVKNAVRRKNLAISHGRCPRCGGNLIQKKGQYGSFYGCSNYPKCRFTTSDFL